ncbi:MAG: hypothetical protein AABX54_03930 [Nanoarchaeota archaeon]
MIIMPTTNLPIFKIKIDEKNRKIVIIPKTFNQFIVGNQVFLTSVKISKKNIKLGNKNRAESQRNFKKILTCT